jgi:hypothetical protein
MKYEKNHRDMYDYIYNSWINTKDHTCNLQIFRNRAGFANTNSNLESFNARLKTDFFNRIVRTIGGVLLVFIEELIPYLSDNCKKFKTYPKYVKKTEIKALTLTKENFSKKDKNSYLYQGKSNRFTIKLNVSAKYHSNVSCECASFVKNGVCLHLVGFSWLYKKSFYTNYSNDPKSFAISMKRGRPAKCKKTGEFK